MNFSFVPPGGGGSAKFNVWAQNTQPEGYDGIWIQTGTKQPVNKVVFEKSVASGFTAIKPDAFPRSGKGNYGGATTVESEKYIVTFGGVASATLKNRVSVYNKTSGQYTVFDASTITNCCRGSGAIVGDTLYIFGGRTDSNYAASSTSTDKVSSYAKAVNLSTQTVTTLTNLPVRKQYASVAAVNQDDIFIGGGCSSYKESGNDASYDYVNVTASNTVYMYHISTNTYTTMANLPDARTNSACIAIPEQSEVLIYSGIKANGGFFYNYETQTTRQTSAAYIGTYPRHYARETCVRIGNNVYAAYTNDISSDGTSASSSMIRNWRCLKYNLNTDSYEIVMDIPNLETTFNPSACSPTFASAEGMLLLIYVGYNSADPYKSAENNYSDYVQEINATEKEWTDNSVVIQTSLTDFEFVTYILGKRAPEKVPLYFKDAFYVKDGTLTSYTSSYGNESGWVQFKEVATS